MGRRMGWEDYKDDGWVDERDGRPTRTMHGAMNEMGRPGDDGWEDERDESQLGQCMAR